MFATQVNVKKVMGDCAPENSFWLVSGTIVRNLHELANTIETLNEWNFVYHCNKEHNDFANWIRNVFEDPYLADELNKEYSQQGTVDKIRNRLKELERF